MALITKPPDIPHLVGEVAVGFHFLGTDVRVIAGRGAHQHGEAQGIRAELIHEHQRIDHVAGCLGYFAPDLIAHEPMQIHGMERNLACKLKTHHDHARHPEEQDVVARFHVGGRVEIFVIRRLIGPAQCGEGPQAGGEPGVQHILILVDLMRAAGGAFGWVFARNGHVTIRAVPDRDAMSPPQLAADAPILDVFQPVEVGLLKALRARS